MHTTVDFGTAIACEEREECGENVYGLFVGI
jgi:hypothetical protein